MCSNSACVNYRQYDTTCVSVFSTSCQPTHVAGTPSMSLSHLTILFVCLLSLSSIEAFFMYVNRMASQPIQTIFRESV